MSDTIITHPQYLIALQQIPHLSSYNITFYTDLKSVVEDITFLTKDKRINNNKQNVQIVDLMKFGKYYEFWCIKMN